MKIDIVLLIALFLFVISGIKIVSFHGDEPMYIYMSKDFNTAFIEKRPMDLITHPPYDFETDSQLRILNGSVNRHVIGLSFYLADIDSSSLPPRPGWNWGLSFEDNVKTGHLPTDEMIFLARLSSAIFLGLSSIVIFLIGRSVAGRPLAYFAGIFYTLNPIVLLNGRRAMMEGYLLFFGLTSILFGILISKNRTEGKKMIWAYWLGLILFSAVALASKQTAIIFVIASHGWIFISEILNFNPKRILKTCIKLLISLIIILSIFIALSPALWSSPYNRLQDLVKTRKVLMSAQVGSNPMSAKDRVKSIILQPFINPVSHFELSYWATFRPVALQIDNYNSSILSGFHFGKYFGLFLTSLAFIGAVVLFFAKLRPDKISKRNAGGLIIWLTVFVCALMLNPLPWQRYYLPMIPIFTILSGIGVISLLQVGIEIIDKMFYHIKYSSYEKD